MSTHTISCFIWNTRPSADLCQIGKFSPSGEIPSLNVGTLSWVTRWSRRRPFWRNLHFQTHCAYQVRGCVNTFCSVSCSARPLITDSLSSSEARHMGGFVGQLCRINSNNSRGAANVSQMQRDENTCHVNVCGWLIDWIDCHFCLPADTEVWQESEVVLWWGDEEDRWALHTKVNLVLRNEQIYIVSCVLCPSWINAACAVSAFEVNVIDQQVKPLFPIFFLTDTV